MSLQSLVISACVLFFTVGALNIAMLKYLHPDWWKNKLVRISSRFLPLAVIGSAIIWALGYKYRLPYLSQPGAIFTPALLILEMTLFVSFPFSGIVHSAARIYERVQRKENDGPIEFSESRRKFLTTASSIFPAVAMTAGISGIVDSYGKIAVPIRHIPIAKLPSDLQGFKIAHLSDPHLGYYVNLDDLAAAVEDVKAYNPDLVLVTGDISDDLKILPDALNIIAQLKAPYGIYASVGNHEYYRGIRAVLKIFENGPFPILINDHVNINIESSRIFLGGADDPRSLRKDYTQFLKNTIDITMRDAPRESFKLLMCHRPEGLNHSALMGVNLVLAGHTHGGQVGLAGRSLFEPIFPAKYMWGIYRHGTTTLHTSGGMGHWFPFRLGVPSEAPILILEKA